jgi:hypothetical protein
MDCKQLSPFNGAIDAHRNTGAVPEIQRDSRAGSGQRVSGERHAHRDGLHDYRPVSVNSQLVEHNHLPNNRLCV